MARKRVTRARTAASEMAGALERSAQETRAKAYPLTEYAEDPVAYVLERLKEPFIMPHQVGMLQALADGIAQKPDASRPTGRCPSNVACRSAQKVGKTKTIAWAALWFFETQKKARVFMCAAIQQQTRNVLWKELGDTLREAQERGVMIDGDLSTSPEGGFVASDRSREIRGVSGRDIEALAGLSGNMLTCIDEASHLPEGKSQAFAGNTLGGGARFLTSNPTRNAGPFYDAFHAMKDFWSTFHVDGEELADWLEKGGLVIPYVINRAKIDEMALMYGKDSPFWALRVKGEWLRNETGRVHPMALIVEAQERYLGTVEDGVTKIGYDPAGETADRGDEHCWCIVRGLKLLHVHRRRGLDEDAAVRETLSLIEDWRLDDECPEVFVDADGPIGAPIAARIRSEGERRQREDVRRAFRGYPVKPSSPKVREPTKFTRVRDELQWALAQWMKAGGAIPRDGKLAAELYEFQWEEVADGRVKLIDKSVMRERLGRSPDSGDALGLAVRQGESAMSEVSPRAAGAAATQNPYRTHELRDQRGRGLYGSLDWARPRKG